MGKPKFLVKVESPRTIEVIELKSHVERARFIAHIRSHFDFMALAVTREELRKAGIGYLFTTPASNYGFEGKVKEQSTL